MKKLELQFKNEEDKTVTLSLDSPIEPADPQVISEVMDDIIEQDVFSSSGGRLMKKHGARIVERTITEVEINVNES